ncbi:MAG TPA: hypothetical protein VE954_32395 [Oligoflexus sp.]|uniref:hypothetical protein n=1 Tax=Oligoflexus sp. TaxID=1971216 RepID=UPI002D6E9581|nr:hypothetical protein [Oligoflexus sp.]HYX37828.1 hypothetical protein [Oligoflexus sp.]
MSTKLKSNPSESEAKMLGDAFWEGFRSAFDFFSVPTAGSYRKYTRILSKLPDVDIVIKISDGLDADAANLNRDLLNITNDAAEATRKVLGKKRS